MPYAEGRIFHDADSHLMETQDWLVSYANPQIRERILPPNFNASGRMAEAIGKKRDAAHWAAVNIETNLMNLKCPGQAQMKSALGKRKALPLGQTEHSFANDVALYFRGSASNRQSSRT